MSIQSEFAAAGEEYARRLDQQRETDRLAALKREARHDGNAEAFAAALEPAFTTDFPDSTTEADDLADLAEAIRNDTAQEN